MEHYIIDKYDFVKTIHENAAFVFSTAVNNLDFNINTKAGIENISQIKRWFNVENVGYLRQVHSNLVYDYDGMIYEGDAIITNQKNTALGVFTADCVPILIYDKVRKVIGAVHSGWKGTLSGVILNTLDKMQKDYGCCVKELVVQIGPHNKGCCYEIGEDVKKMFKDCKIYDNAEIIKNNRLNLEKCITTQLLSRGVLRENISSLNLCTFCSDSVSLHSYRKSKDKAGRMFSFIYLS